MRGYWRFYLLGIVFSTAMTVSALDDEENIYDLISFGKTEALRTLLSKKPSLATTRHGRYGETPLQFAATQRRKGMVTILLDAGAKMDALSAAALNDVEQLEAILKKEPWQAKPPNRTLHAAIETGNIKSVKLLLACGADPNLDFGFSNVLGPYTPLSKAVAGGHYEIAQLLLEHGAKTDVSGGKNYDSLLELASTRPDPKFRLLLLKYTPER